MLTKPERAVDKVFIHCSASDNPAHDNVETIRSWHKQRGFNDIGYHFYINKQGVVLKGRAMEKIPAAQAGHNKGSVAICLGGLNHFSQEQFFSLKKLCAEIKKLLPHVTFHGHCEVSNKTCPNFDYKKILGL
jgi:N-acetylmuramoyl-L-alanine amidase